MTACVYTLSCFHFSHLIVIPLIYSEQNIIKNIKIDVFNLILYIQKKNQDFIKIQLWGRASCDPGEKWHLQVAEDREVLGSFAAGPLQAPHQLTIQSEIG